MTRSPHIAVIDDDLSVREALRSFVSSLGHPVKAFASAEDFLASNIRATSCVITDVQMPGMSGVELLDRLIDDGHRIPFIFVTAYPRPGTLSRYAGHGAVGYLSKPLREDSLVACLGLALN